MPDIRVIGALGRWSKTRTALRLWYLSLAALIGALAWALWRPSRSMRTEPSLVGDVEVLRAVGGGVSSRSGTGSFDVIVRLPSGQERRATLLEPLAAGQHLWAIYSTGPNDSRVRLVTYTRCGSKACPQGGP